MAANEPSKKQIMGHMAANETPKKQIMGQLLGNPVASQSPGQTTPDSPEPVRAPNPRTTTGNVAVKS